MAGKPPAGECNGFLVEGRRYHGVGFSAQAQLRGDAHVLHRRDSAAGVQPAECELLDAGESSDVAKFRRLQLEAGNPLRPFQDAAVEYHNPAGQRRELRIGKSLDNDFGADSGWIAHTYRNGRQAFYRSEEHTSELQSLRHLV